MIAFTFYCATFDQMGQKSDKNGLKMIKKRIKKDYLGDGLLTHVFLGGVWPGFMTRKSDFFNGFWPKIWTVRRVWSWGFDENLHTTDLEWGGYPLPLPFAL